jgi:hypothetical protein
VDEPVVTARSTRFMEHGHHGRPEHVHFRPTQSSTQAVSDFRPCRLAMVCAQHNGLGRRMGPSIGFSHSMAWGHNFFLS